jgi:hypothetical protein
MSLFPVLPYRLYAPRYLAAAWIKLAHQPIAIHRQLAYRRDAATWHCYLAGVCSYSGPRSYFFRNYLCWLQLNSVDALQVALDLTWYNAVPACLAHSYLMFNYMLKVLALYTN